MAADTGRVKNHTSANAIKDIMVQPAAEVKNITNTVTEKFTHM